MELELLRRYGGIALGFALAVVLFWLTTGRRIGSALGIPRLTTRQLVQSGLAAVAGLAGFILVERTAPSPAPWVALLGFVGILVLAGIQASRRPEIPLPRTDLLLRWSIPIALVLLALGLAIRMLLGPGAAFGLVAGLGLGLLPGIVLLALFTLVTRLARSGHN